MVHVITNDMNFITYSLKKITYRLSVSPSSPPHPMKNSARLYWALLQSSNNPKFPVASSVMCFQEGWRRVDSGKFSGSHCCAAPCAAGTQERTDHVHCLQRLDIQRAGQMEHRQSNPHGQFRQEVNIFGASAQARFLSHVLSVYQSHTCVLILFSPLLHCFPSNIFPSVLRYYMHILGPKSDVGIFVRYAMNSLVLQTEWLKFFGSIMLVI